MQTERGSFTDPDIRKGFYIVNHNPQFDPILQAVTDKKIGYFDQISWK